MNDNQQSHINQRKEPMAMNEYVKELNQKSLVEVVSNIIRKILLDINRDTLIRIVENHIKNNFDKEEILKLIYTEIRQNQMKEQYSKTTINDDDYQCNLWNIERKDEEQSKEQQSDLKDRLTKQLEEYIGLKHDYESFLIEYSNSYDLNLWQDTLGSLMLGLNEESEEMGREITELLLLLFKLDKTIQLFDGTIKGFFRGDHQDIFHLFKKKLKVIESNEEVIEDVADNIQQKYSKTREKMIKEMGDIYAYFTLIRLFFDVSIEEIMKDNQNKLQERWEMKQHLRSSREMV